MTGMQGATGDRGQTGYQGMTGMQGATGSIGATYAIGTGLAVLSNTLYTVGNPNIQLTSHSLFGNENVISIQSQINNANQADVIYISSGSYSENISISNKYNIALQSPQVGNTICQVSGLSVSGTSELIRIANLQIFGAESNIQGTGRNYYSRCTWQGSASVQHIINIGAGVSQYQTFENCEFDQYCTINISAYLANVIYFINCNFGGAVLNLNQGSPQIVIINNCAGLSEFPTNATLIGMNVLLLGESLNTTTTTNTKYMIVAGDTTKNSVNQVITTNGTQGLKLTPVGGANSYWNVSFDNGQQTVKNSVGGLITLYETAGVGNLLPNKRILFKCIFNFTISATNSDIVFTLYYTETTDVDIQHFTQSLSRNGHHSMPITFNYTIPENPTIYNFPFKITAQTTNGTIATDVKDYYSVIVDELQNSG
jgi:hypothetical protein